MRWPQRNNRTFIVQSDGALAGNGSRAGLGVLVRDGHGRIVRWISQSAKGMTNNEAEYAALCLALEILVKEKPQAVHVFSDSEVLVYQMQGRFQVSSPDLRRWHRRACQLARRIPLVTYTHIPRERNQLADALANEALQSPLPLPVISEQ